MSVSFATFYSVPFDFWPCLHFHILSSFSHHREREREKKGKKKRKEKEKEKGKKEKKEERKKKKRKERKGRRKPEVGVVGGRGWGKIRQGSGGSLVLLPPTRPLTMK